MPPCQPWNLQKRVATWMNGARGTAPRKGAHPFAAFVCNLAADHEMLPDSTLKDVYERYLASLPDLEEDSVMAVLSYSSWSETGQAQSYPVRFFRKCPGGHPYRISVFSSDTIAAIID